MTTRPVDPSLLHRIWQHETVRASLLLALLLNLLFAPVIWGDRSLLESARTPSLLPTGAAAGPSRGTVQKVLDSGGPAWQFEPSIQLNHNEWFRSGTLPLWDPYRGFGSPLAATMQPQPFYPLAILAAIHPSPRTFDLFLISRLFVAGLFGFLFFRLFFPFLPAFGGAVALMFSGYYILYIDISHLSVDVLLPAVLWAAEALVREQSVRRVLWLSAIVFLVLVGGMPETALIVLAYGALYFLFRVLSDATLRSRFVGKTISFAAAHLFGFLWAAFLLLPFLELMHNGFDIHQSRNLAGEIAGAAADPLLYRWSFPYITPLVFGLPWGNILAGPVRFSGIRGTFGVAAILLAAIAMGAAIRDFRRGRWKLPAVLTVFFFASVVFCWMKRFGLPEVNWVGSLPLLDLIHFPKYIEIVPATAVAWLAAAGLACLLEQSMPRRLVLAIQGGVAALLLLAFAKGFELVRAPGTTDVVYFYASFAGAVAVLSILFALTAGFYGRRKTGPHPLLSFGVLALLTLEVSTHMIVPMYYLAGTLPTQEANPYAALPYIDFLRNQSPGQWRLFARDNILHPNWAGNFGFYDVRSLDAMYYYKYLTFVRAFLGEHGDGPDGDLYDRFTGIGPYDLGHELPQRFLRLSSVKYVLSVGALPPGPYAEIYADKDVKIFQVFQPVPRAAIFYHAELADNEAALRRLSQPGFDIDATAVLSGPLDSGQRTALDAVLQAPKTPAEPAVITNYRPQTVDISTVLRAPGVLVLNDTGYPGWQATVDGRPATVLAADYLFRAVLLTPGRHTVRFHYAPSSFNRGLGLSAFGLLAAIALVLVCRRLDARFSAELEKSSHGN